VDKVVHVAYNISPMLQNLAEADRLCTFM